MEICGLLQEGKGAGRMEMAQFLCYYYKYRQKQTEYLILKDSAGEYGEGTIPQDTVVDCSVFWRIDRKGHL